MKYWIAKCSSCGEVKIAQKTKPTTCSEQVKTGTRSIRLCGNSLIDQQDVTAKVQAALAAKSSAVASAEQAEVALASANAAYLSELERDCERSEGSGAQELRREDRQQSLRDAIAQCERDLEKAKRHHLTGTGGSASA